MEKIDKLKRFCNLTGEEIKSIEENYWDFADTIDDAIKSYENYIVLLSKKSSLNGEYSSLNYSLYENLLDMERLSIRLSGYYSEIKARKISIPGYLQERIEYMIANYLKTRNG